MPVGMAGEFVIIDNNSTDETQDVIAEWDPPFWEVRRYIEEKPGLSHARNRAVSEAQGNVLLFTDDDVRIPNKWIGPMTRPILAGMADAVAGGIELASHLRRSWMTPRSRSVLADTCLLDSDDPEYFVGANMAIGSHVFDTISGFDPEIDAGPNSLGFAGDVLFALQMRSVGFRIAGVLDTTIEHHFDPARLTRTAYVETMRKQGRSEAYIDYHWRHCRPIEGTSNLWVALIKTAGRLSLERARVFAHLPSEGMETWEMRTLTRLHRIWQFLRERKRPRNYDQYGTEKKSGVPFLSPTPSSTDQPAGLA